MGIGIGGTIKGRLGSNKMPTNTTALTAPDAPKLRYQLSFLWLIKVGIRQKNKAEIYSPRYTIFPWSLNSSVEENSFSTDSPNMYKDSMLNNRCPISAWISPQVKNRYHCCFLVIAGG